MDLISVPSYGPYPFVSTFLPFKYIHPAITYSLSLNIFNNPMAQGLHSYSGDEENYSNPSVYKLNSFLQNCS
jgi:hypothetical protein